MPSAVSPTRTRSSPSASSTARSRNCAQANRTTTSTTGAARPPTSSSTPSAPTGSSRWSRNARWSSRADSVAGLLTGCDRDLRVQLRSELQRLLGGARPAGCLHRPLDRGWADDGAGDLHLQWERLGRAAESRGFLRFGGLREAVFAMGDLQGRAGEPEDGERDFVKAGVLLRLRAEDGTAAERELAAGCRRARFDRLRVAGAGDEGDADPVLGAAGGVRLGGLRQRRRRERSGCE